MDSYGRIHEGTAPSQASTSLLKLSQCGISLEKRFAFYDQIHTTVMDIQHTLTARAALTLGKDMVFRELAQGAYRMRGIGIGQGVTMFVIPEVLHRAPPPPSFLCSSLSVSSSHCLCLARKPLRSTASTAWRVPPLSPLPYSRPQSFYALHHHERYHHMNSAVELVMLTLSLCAGPETGGTVLTIGGAFPNCRCLPPPPPWPLPLPCAARLAGPLVAESRRYQGIERCQAPGPSLCTCRDGEKRS